MVGAQELHRVVVDITGVAYEQGDGVEVCIGIISKRIAAPLKLRYTSEVYDVLDTIRLDLLELFSCLEFGRRS
jgi:hypothetical protein